MIAGLNMGTVRKNSLQTINSKWEHLQCFYSFLPQNMMLSSEDIISVFQGVEVWDK